jgi:opacity protein-like surface antigen
MKRSIQSLLLILAISTIATAAMAQDAQDSKTPIVIQDPNLFNEGHLWVGRWSANADSNFWDDNFQNFKAGRGRLGGVLFGGDYIHHVDRHNAFMLSAGGYANSISEPARHVLDENGNPLEHHLDLDTLSLTVGYMFYPAGTGHPVIPYLGVGAGLYAGEIRSYQSSSSTETCTDDDDDSTCTTETSYTNSKSSTFFTFGYFALAGLEVPVSSHAALLLEGRYTEAQAHLEGNFYDNRNLDLSGGQYTVGVAIHF